MYTTPLAGREKGRAPVPMALPGEFFVLEYDREGQAFILHVDDEDRSTYDLGSDPAELQLLFRLRKVETTDEKLQPLKIDSMIDIARELGMAQYIPAPGELVEDRVLSIVPRDVPHRGIKFNDDQDQNWVHGIR